MNPEQKIIDDIDALVNEQLTHTPDDYSRNDERYDKCELCQGLWHGRPNHRKCPGAWASEADKEAWRQAQSKSAECPWDSAYSGYVEQGGRVQGFVRDDSGHTVQGIITFLDGQDDEGSFTAIFVPDDENEYRYAPTESNDSDRQGFSSDLVLMDEAAQIQQAWSDCIARQQNTEGWHDLGYMDDTP